MSKILALDIGDQWTGIAISDPLRLLAKPLVTVETLKLEQNLSQIISKEKIEIIVIGYPKTMRGTESEQTRKVVEFSNNLKNIFKDIEFVLWDERLSSKRASSVATARSKEEKLKSHAIASSFVLDSYLTYLLTKNQ